MSRGLTAFEVPLIEASPVAVTLVANKLQGSDVYKNLKIPLHQHMSFHNSLHLYKLYYDTCTESLYL